MTQLSVTRNGTPGVERKGRTVKGRTANAASRTLWGDALRRLLKNRLAVISFFWIVFVVRLALSADLWVPQVFGDPTLVDTNMTAQLSRLSPSPAHPFGTDSLGRDVFTRALYGGRVSLSFALVSIFFTFVIGLTLGGLSGYMGGLVDGLVQRTIDVIMSIPGIPLWMALAAALPKEMSSYTQYLLMCIIMSLIGWTGLARVVRGKILSVREEEFVTAARLSGATHKRVVFKHMLPMFMSYIIVSITGSIPATILGETSLSFLGLGLQPPTISWGTLLQDCQTVEAIAQQPWKMFPAAFIVVTVLMFNFAGDGLRDAADPYKQG
ncbi:MAG: ABC transporter permease [Oscillospiraceae bacterium]|jgi:peptide/nickel transport system permease protein|nr:ABC transporter permease [Oscillospiraceae bacterium]